MITRKSFDDFNFTLSSLDRSSSIHFDFNDIESEMLPSISCLVHVIDHSFIGSIDIWIEESLLQKFHNNLKEMIISREGSFCLSSMSPEEFSLSIVSVKKRLFYIKYSIKKNRYSSNLLNETILSGSFEYDSEYLYKFEQDLRNIMRLFK